MRHTLIFIAEFFITSLSFGQTLSRQYNETVEMFANRVKPSYTDIAHTVIETKQLDTNKNAIIAFYYQRITDAGQMLSYAGESYHEIILGYLFLPKTNSNYEKILIDTIPEDGGETEIISIFFANADRDKNNEIIVLCKDEQRHYDENGYIYETYIYKYDKIKKSFKYLSKLSETFWGCECDFRDGKIKRAKYKTAKEVKARLKKLGFY